MSTSAAFGGKVAPSAVDQLSARLQLLLVALPRDQVAVEAYVREGHIVASAAPAAAVSTSVHNRFFSLFSATAMIEPSGVNPKSDKAAPRLFLKRHLQFRDDPPPGAAVDRRTMSVSFSTARRGVAAPALSTCSITMVAASRPICSVGRAIVVSGGMTSSTGNALLNVATLKSSGTRMPASQHFCSSLIAR